MDIVQSAYMTFRNQIYRWDNDACRSVLQNCPRTGIHRRDHPRHKLFWRDLPIMLDFKCYSLLFYLYCNILAPLIPLSGFLCSCWFIFLFICCLASFLLQPSSLLLDTYISPNIPSQTFHNLPSYHGQASGPYNGICQQGHQYHLRCRRNLHGEDVFRSRREPTCSQEDTPLGQSLSFLLFVLYRAFRSFNTSCCNLP